MPAELWNQVDTDLYQILGVSPLVSGEQLQTAWRQTAKRTHPDRGGSIEDFQQAEIAYQVLSNPLERNRYDRLQNAKSSLNNNPTLFFKTTPTTTPPNFDFGYIPEYEYDYREVQPLHLGKKLFFLLLVIPLLLLAFFVLHTAFFLPLFIIIFVTLFATLLKSSEKQK